MSNDTPDPDITDIIAADQMIHARGGVEGSEITAPGDDLDEVVDDDQQPPTP